MAVKDVDKRTGIYIICKTPPFCSHPALTSPTLSLPPTHRSLETEKTQVKFGLTTFPNVISPASCTLARNIKSYLHVYNKTPLYEFNYSIDKSMSKDLRDQQKPHVFGLVYLQTPTLSYTDYSLVNKSKIIN